MQLARWIPVVMRSVQSYRSDAPLPLLNCRWRCCVPHSTASLGHIFTELFQLNCLKSDCRSNSNKWPLIQNFSFGVVLLFPIRLSLFLISLLSYCDSFTETKIRCSYPCNWPWRPLGLRDVEATTFSRHLAHRWQWGCQPYAPAALYLQEDFWYSFLLDAESTPGP
jgi:hypothetical protein